VFKGRWAVNIKPLRRITPAKYPIPIDKSINPNNKSTLSLHVHVFTTECEISAAENLSPDVREHNFKENMIFNSLL
jgi:hypothetical protein